MADDTQATTEEPKKKGGLKKILLLVVLVLVLGGGGAAGGFYAAGTFGHNGAKEDPNAPKVVLKDGTKISANDAGIEQAAVKTKTSHFKTTYHKIEEPFTANLQGGEGFAQFSLAVSTYYDDKVINALTEHDIAIRSAILLNMAEHDSQSLETREGKQNLQAELAQTINQVLKNQTGFEGVEDVYFTSIVIQ